MEHVGMVYGIWSILQTAGMTILIYLLPFGTFFPLRQEKSGSTVCGSFFQPPAFTRIAYNLHFSIAGF
jgi:hypothetical protein